MLLVSTQFQKYLDTLTEDKIMRLTKQVVIKAESVADARSKVAKFVKRGAHEDSAYRCSTKDLTIWENDHELWVTVYPDGEVRIHSHSCQPATYLKRVRDVENYRV